MERSGLIAAEVATKVNSLTDGARSDHGGVQRQLDRLARQSPGRDTLGLDRIGELCARLGNPQDRLPPVFHVAGTNGKGSTCAFLRAMLEADGKAAHVFTSPHLVRFNERIRVAGALIEDAALAATLEEVLDAAAGLSASFFEVTTAAAFLAFARTPADACILEVGLGGRLDATNVVCAPAACGIAALGIDHEAFLLSPEPGAPGNPGDRIAWEKAGIAKRDCPLVTLKCGKSERRTIAQQAESVGAPLLVRGADWDICERDGALHYRDAAGGLALPYPALGGVHQYANAGLAVAMLRHQEVVSVNEAALVAGVIDATWPARLQRLGAGPLRDNIPKDNAVWVDGGHNPLAGAALAEHFRHAPDGSIHLVLAMLSNKRPDAMLAPLHAKLSGVTVVPLLGHDAHELPAFAPYFPNARVAASLIEAMESIEASDVLIAGSLYLAGEALRLNREFPT